MIDEGAGHSLVACRASLQLPLRYCRFADYPLGIVHGSFLGPPLSSARKQGATSLEKIPRTLVVGLT